jgi:hypothetical protein
VHEVWDAGLCAGVFGGASGGVFYEVWVVRGIRRVRVEWPAVEFKGLGMRSWSYVGACSLIPILMQI